MSFKKRTVFIFMFIILFSTKRFKVSVVTEPDASKLTVPEKKRSDSEPSEVVAVINEGYKNLERAVENCYAFKPGKIK